MTRPGVSAPRLLYVVSEDWYFLSHRLPMARAARAAGFAVHVATHVGEGAEAIHAEGFVLHPVPFARGRLAPLASLATIRALRRLHRAVQPDLIHHISLQPSFLGLIAVLGRRIPCIAAFTGLGHSFTARGTKAGTLKRMLGMGLRVLLDRGPTISLVQNSDDLATLRALGIPKSRIALIRGSGVDVQRLTPLAEPAGPPTVAFVGRLLDDKGVRTLVAAHRLLRTQGSDIRLLIAGEPDPANPSSVSAEEAARWNDEPGITRCGHVADIADIWARAHIAALPSRREGMPLSLLEAAACERSMVATDTPGCRDIVIHGETGLLVPVDDVAALADAIGRLASSPDLRAKFAAAARRLAVARFSADLIGRQTLDLYRTMLAHPERLSPAAPAAALH